MAKKFITIKLTQEEALHVWKNIDGWVDAGSCNGGLEPDEQAALEKLLEAISEQTPG